MSLHTAQSTQKVLEKRRKLKKLIQERKEEKLENRTKKRNNRMELEEVNNLI